MAHKEKLHVWIERNLKELVYKKAQQKGISISEYVRYILRKETDES